MTESVDAAGTARPICQVGDPVLRTPCEPVTVFDDALRGLVADMYASMAAADGVGLAANQIGVGLRVFVYDCPDETETWHRGCVVNPRLVETGGEWIVHDEGCLSVVGLFFETGRHDYAVVEGVDDDNQPVRIASRGMLGRCLQHETDHLDGRLYLDRLEGDVRREALRVLREGPA